jgi:hypothetical protein
VPHHDGGGGRDTKDSGDSDGGAYRVKRIEFKGKTIPIITQNENGTHTATYPLITPFTCAPMPLFVFPY